MKQVLTLLQSEENIDISQSWGTANVTICKVKETEYLMFLVNGFIFQGCVVISENNKVYRIQLIEQGGKAVKEIYATLSEIVEIIDVAVERGAMTEKEYKARANEFLMQTLFS